MEVASAMTSKEDRGEESSLSATLSCTLSGDLSLAWYWRGRWEIAFSCCRLLSRAVGVYNSVRDVLTSDLSLGWYWLGRWAMVFPWGMLLGRAVGVCKPVTIRGFVTSDLSLAFPCWMWLGRTVGVCKPVTTRGFVISELIFLTCIWAEPCVVDGKELRKFLLTAMDVCISCIALTDDSPELLSPFFGSVPLTLFQLCLHSDLVPKEGLLFVVLLSVLLSPHQLNAFAWQVRLHHTFPIHSY